jgi:flagellar assembly protein FliH
MSSKIVSGDSEELREFPWKPLPGATQPPAGTSPGGNSPALMRARIEEMDRQLPEIIDKARREGAREAEAAAAVRMEQEVETLQRRIAASVEQILRLREHMRRQMEEDLVRLAVAIARRILRRELSVDPDALTGVVRAAIDQTEARQLHRLRVGPADRALIERMLAAMPLASPVEVVGDPSLERGAAILETVRGTIDASVETQLQEVERGLADLVRRQR